MKEKETPQRPKGIPHGPPMCSSCSAVSIAQGQVEHNMQSFSNQIVNILIKMMTWYQGDCGSSPLCTELTAEGLSEEILTLLHKDAD